MLPSSYMLFTVCCLHKSAIAKSVCEFHHWTLQYKSSIINVALIVCGSFEMNSCLLKTRFKVPSSAKIMIFLFFIAIRFILP